MKRYPILLAATCAMAACAPAVPPPEPVARLSDSVGPSFDPVAVQADLEATARQRFGEPLVAAALASHTYWFAKHYMGLPPPPVVQPDGTYKHAAPPMAMLVRQNGQWLTATANGFRPAKPDKAAAIEAMVRNVEFWREPPWAQPGCTDAGGSLLMLKAPPRERIVRQGACGATQNTERLVFLALEA